MNTRRLVLIGLWAAAVMTSASCAVAPVVLLVAASSGGPGYEDLVREARRLKVKVDRPGEWSVKMDRVDMRGKYRVGSGKRRPWAIKALVTWTACPAAGSGACFTSQAERMYLFRRKGGRWQCYRSEPASGWVVKKDDSLPNPAETLRQLR